MAQIAARFSAAHTVLRSLAEIVNEAGSRSWLQCGVFWLLTPRARAHSSEHATTNG